MVERFGLTMAKWRPVSPPSGMWLGTITLSIVGGLTGAVDAGVEATPATARLTAPRAARTADEGPPGTASGRGNLKINGQRTTTRPQRMQNKNRTSRWGPPTRRRGNGDRPVLSIQIVRGLPESVTWTSKMYNSRRFHPQRYRPVD